MYLQKLKPQWCLGLAVLYVPSHAMMFLSHSAWLPVLTLVVEEVLQSFGIMPHCVLLVSFAQTNCLLSDSPSALTPSPQEVFL